MVIQYCIRWTQMLHVDSSAIRQAVVQGEIVYYIINSVDLEIFVSQNFVFFGLKIFSWSRTTTNIF